VRLEEEAVVARDGCEVIARFRSEKLLVAGTPCFTAGGERRRRAIRNQISTTRRRWNESEVETL
jgi:ribosomal protein S6E (S10)